jgi:formylglycine-generating enzyme required for sulfatase activity
MGCKSGRDGTCSNDRELPLHTVKVNDFRIGKYEVTQAIWEDVMGSLPSSISTSEKGANKPVIYVSYDDVVAENTGFLAKLNKLTGKNYRLPTEAEWEYAARGCSAGTCESYPYSGSDKIDNVAWSSSNCSALQPVGKKAPNALGIHDMSGNVFEWCLDYYSESFYTTTTTNNPVNTANSSSRVSRGGSWNGSAGNCRVASRNNYSPSPRYNFHGFRVVLP